MRHERAFLEEVVESLADGNDIDWAALDGRVDSADDRRVLEQLKILARIAEVHRSEGNEPDPPPLLRSQRAFGGKVIPMPVSAPADAPPLNGIAVNGAAAPPLTATQVAPVPPAITRWGHLELQERIGEGTFGEVYRARDTRLEREVAVKLLRVGGLSTGSPDAPRPARRPQPRSRRTRQRRRRLRRRAARRARRHLDGVDRGPHAGTDCCARTARSARAKPS